jgi:hypothetical protein
MQNVKKKKRGIVLDYMVDLMKTLIVFMKEFNQTAERMAFQLKNRAHAQSLAAAVDPRRGLKGNDGSQGVIPPNL